MSRPRSRVADYLAYLLVRCLVCFLQALPYEAGCVLARGLAQLLYHLDRRHREVARDNLRHAFPEMTDVQRDRMVRAVFLHFCVLLIDLMHLPLKMHPRSWRRYLELPQGKELVDVLLSNRPALIVTGHFGNWEIGGYMLGLLGFSTHAVARPLDNPYLDDFLRRFRERTGQGLLAKKGDFDQMQALMAGNGILATLADQDAGQRGLFVDFFGRPASTHKAIALLALEYNVPLVVSGTVRIGHPMRHTVFIGEVIQPDDYRGRPDAVRALTQRFTTALESMVRKAPEQYFWLHRRWKHQPKAKGAKRAA